MASPYILGEEEEEEFYDDYYDTYGGPDVFGGDDFWPVQIPEEVVQEPTAYDYPSYVRSGAGRPAQFWQDEYGGGPSPDELARATEMPPYGVHVTPEGQLDPRVAWDPARGLAPLRKLALTPEETQAGMEWLASYMPSLISGPDLTDEERELLRSGPIVPGSEAKTISGISQGLWNTAEGLTSPINLGLMAGTAGLSGIPLAARGLSGAFALDMAQHVPELSRELGEAWESGDEERIARAATELGATGAFTTMAGTHALHRPMTIPGEIREAFGRSDNPRVRAIEEALNKPTGETVSPGDAAGRLPAEAAREREISLTRGDVPTDPVERANFEQDLFGLGAERNTELGLNGNWRVATPEESVGNWRASVDEADGTVVLNLDKVRRWIGSLKPEQRVRAVQAMFLEEGIHGIALKEFTKTDVADLWGRLTDAERRLVEKSYGKLGPNDVPAGWSTEAMYGHEYLRRQMGRLLREPVREKAEAKGYQWLKETAIDAIERVIITARRTMDRFRKDPSTSKRLDSMLTRMQDHIDAARKAKGMEPVDWKARLQGAPAALEGGPRALDKADGDKKPGLAAMPQFAGKNVSQVLDTLDLVSNKDLASYEGGMTRFMWDLGSMARGPEDVAALRAYAESQGAKGSAEMKAGNFDTAMEILGRQPAEAYEYATGVKIDGTPKWDMFEKRDPSYKPAVPDPKYTAAKAPKGSEAPPAPPPPAPDGAAEPGPQPPPIVAAPRALNKPQQDRHNVVNRVREFFGGLPDRLRALPNRLAGQDAPVTFTASPESANRLVEYASGKIAAPEVARAMASEVLGEKYKDADFGQRLGGVLVEDRLRTIMDERRNAGDPNWNDVTSIVGHPNSPFRTEADFRRALADPEIKAAIRRHKDTVQRVAQAQHQLARGELAGRGRHTGAFVNLEAVLPDQPAQTGGGGRGNLMNPLRRKSRFSRRAKGTAEEYHLDYRRLSERMIEANFEEATKRRMYGQLVQDGLAVMTNPGQPIPAGFDAHHQPFTIERKGTPAGGGAARTFVKYLWVKKNIYPEVRQALNVDGKVGEAAIINAANALNQIQLAGPTDAVWHIANMVGSIAGSQGGRNLLTDVVRKIPGVNLMDALGRTAASSIKVLRDTPEIQKQIAELAKIGAMRAQEGRGVVPLGEKNAKLRLLNPANLIQLLDRGGRLVRDNLYKNMVRRGLVQDSPANRRLWVNQMGQYNARLMGQLQRYFKEWGFSPFVVAGRNFNKMAMRRMILSQGVKARNPAAAAQMKAVDALGMVATLVVVPSVLNYLITGNPSGRPGTKFGQIDTGQDTKDGKHLVIDPGQWSGIRRGMRITGAQGLIEGLREGQRGERITEQMAKDIVGGVIHPWTGPAVHGVSVAATGYSPSGYKESENPKDFGANITAAAKQLNPLFKAAIEGHEERRGVVAQVGLSLGGAVGLKAVRPLTSYDRMRNIHEKWLADNPDRKIRESFERNETATFPISQYRDLDKFIRNKDSEGMMEALQKVREVALDKDILKRMLPVIGTGINQQPKPLFHESAQSEAQFRLSLSPKQLEEYQQALEDRKENFQRFLEVWRERGPRPEVLEAAQP